jgi:16S rRNA processing protein RimM
VNDSNPPSPGADENVDDVAVGRIGKAHGVRGDVFVDPWTDSPEERFRGGATLRSQNGSQAPLTVLGSRDHSGKLVVHFEGIDDRASAQQLRGQVLVISASTRPPIKDPDEFYDTDLIGLRAGLLQGGIIGEVAEVLHAPGASVLAIRDRAGQEILVPFRKEIVPVVDVDAGMVLIDPPEGLLDQ